MGSSFFFVIFLFVSLNRWRGFLAGLTYRHSFWVVYLHLGCVSKLISKWGGAAPYFFVHSILSFGNIYLMDANFSYIFLCNGCWIYSFAVLLYIFFNFIPLGGVVFVVCLWWCMRNSIMSWFHGLRNIVCVVEIVDYSFWKCGWWMVVVNECFWEWELIYGGG